MWDDDICFTTDDKAAGTHLLIATLALIISTLTFIWYRHTSDMYVHSGQIVRVGERMPAV
jgi:hypothetical protein